MMESFYKKSGMGMFLIVSLTFFVYSFALPGTFKTMDDEYSIVQDERIKSISNIGLIFTTSFFGIGDYYRPLVSLSYMLEYHLFGLNPFYFYLTNILLHIATSLCIFALMALIFKEEVVRLSIALLFAIHPIHWEAVSNIPGRAILLSAFFSINAFLFFLLSGRKKYCYYLCLILFFLALLSKESALVFPLLILSYLGIVKRTLKEKSGTIPPGLSLLLRGKEGLSLFYPLIPMFFIEGIYLLLRHLLEITKLFFWRNSLEVLLGFLTFLRSVITHLWLLFFPIDLMFDRSRALFTTLFNTEVLLTILFFGICLFVFLRLRKTISPEGLFFMTWFWIELIPVSQIIVTIGIQPGYISTAEHFLYTPSLGVFVLIVLFLKKFYQKCVDFKTVSPRIFKWAVLGLYLFLLICTMQHNIYSSNEMAMLVRSLKLNPKNIRIRYNFAYAYVKLKQFNEAEDQFRQILAIDPNHIRSRIGLGKTLCDQGKYWECIQEYEQIKDAGDLNWLLKGNTNATLVLLIGKYNDLLSRDPSDPDVHYSLGVVYSKRGQIEKALEHYERAVQLKPNFKNALFNLASCLESLKKFERAVDYYEQVINLPGEKDELDNHALIHLSQIYEKLGEIEKARKYNDLNKKIKNTDDR